MLVVARRDIRSERWYIVCMELFRENWTIPVIDFEVACPSPQPDGIEIPGEICIRDNYPDLPLSLELAVQDVRSCQVLGRCARALILDVYNCAHRDVRGT